jgi:HD-GYP domain-containing protein (c-di-GMP phosphodiesterase class II)
MSILTALAIPRGLKVGRSPLGACILVVADAYDALTSGRSYCSHFSHSQAIGMLRTVAERSGIRKRLGPSSG